MLSSSQAALGVALWVDIAILLQIGASQPHLDGDQPERTRQLQQTNGDAAPKKNAAKFVARQNETGGSAEDKKHTNGDERHAWIGAFVRSVEGLHEFWVAFGTIIIAAFTAILGVGTFLLWSATRNLVKGAKHTAERQLRAYINIDIEKIDLSTTALTEVVLRVTNVGQTPAYELVANSWVDLRPWPYSPNGRFEGPPDPNLPAKSIINPSQARRFKTGSARPLTEQELADVALGTRKRLYVYGLVTYKDTFGHPRFAEFCLAVKTAPGEKVDTAYCRQHNKAD